MAKKKMGGLGKGLDSLFAELPDISDEPSSSTLPLRDESQVMTHYSQAISALWFTRQSQRNNPGRGVIWQTFPDDDPQLEEQVVTASIPLDFAG